MLNDKAIQAGFLELHALKVENDVPSDERRAAGRKARVDFRLEGRHDVLIFGALSSNGKIINAIVLGIKKQAHGKGALRVSDWELASAQGVKSAQDAELALVIGSEVAKGGEKNLHTSLCDKPSLHTSLKVHSCHFAVNLLGCKLLDQTSNFCR